MSNPYHDPAAGSRFSDSQNPYAAPTVLDVNEFGGPEGLRRVATGLNLVYYGIVVVLISTMGGALMMGAAGASGNLAIVSIVAVLIGVGILGGTVLGIVGRVSCLGVPEASGGKGMILGAVVCDAIGIVLALSQFVVSHNAVQAIGNLVGLVGMILFIIFIKRTANYISRTDLADNAQSLITLGIAAVVLMVFLVAITFVLALQDRASAPSPALACPAGLLGLGLMVLALVMLVKYARLLLNLRQAILESA